MIEWNGKRVLVCGGAGLIGSYTAKELLQRGAEVVVVDNLSSGSEKNIMDILPDIRFLEWDLRDRQYCELATRGIDAVFMYAADMGGIGYITKVGADIMHNSAMINLNMLVSARNNEVPHYFWSSSACVYPEYRQKEADVVPLKESDAFPAEPDQFYGWEKLFTEKLCEAFERDYNMNIKVARFHNIMGECYTAYDKDKGKAPAHMVMKAIKYPDPAFVMWGDGKATRSFCYVTDAVEAVLKLMDSIHKDPINIGSDRLISMNDLADMAIKLSGKDIKILYDLSKPMGVRGRNADLTIVKKALDWEPEVSLEEGMKRMYLWAVEHYEELENI